MSRGFLHHLVRRSLMAEAVVRPRPVSIFEPVAVPARRTRLTDGHLEFAVEAPRDVRPASRVLDAPPRPVARVAPAATRSADADGAEGTARDHDAPHRDVVSSQPVRHASTPGASRTADRVAVAALEPPPAAVRMASRVVQAPPADAHPAPGGRTSSSFDRHTLRPEGVAQARPAAHRALHGAPDAAIGMRPLERPPRPPDAGQSMDIPHATLVPRLPQLPQLPQSPPLPVRGPRVTGSSVEPAIHVTIGRVEVRAVQAATPTKAPASIPPPLSLHEYLHRRGGAGR